MHPKAFALPFHVGHAALAQPVVVEPGFADANDFGQAGALQQVVQAGLLHIFVVGVHADGGPEVVVAGGKPVNAFKFFERGADTQGSVYLGILHGTPDLRQLRLQFGETQMAMGVGEHSKTAFRYEIGRIPNSDGRK